MIRPINVKGDDIIKKSNISISYDEEKLNALRMFMLKKGIDLDSELVVRLDKMYNKYVSVDVREFIAERYGNEVIEVRNERK